jgi:hypothetical protein
LILYESSGRTIRGRNMPGAATTDDAHESVENFARHVAAFMLSGDYYVVEDVLLYHSKRVGVSRTAFDADRLALAFDMLGFLVDTKYADAFGLNVTASPNGWLIKQ